MTLIIKQFIKGKLPEFVQNRETNIEDYKGLHLIYANQCPYTIKSVDALKKVCSENGIDLNVVELNSAKDAQQTPSVYGVYNLIYNGKLLAEHYISETRFKNILEKEQLLER